MMRLGLWLLAGIWAGMVLPALAQQVLPQQVLPQQSLVQQPGSARACFGQVSTTFISDRECAWIEGQTVQMLQARDTAAGFPCKSAYRFTQQPFKMLDRVRIDFMTPVLRQRLFIALLDRCHRRSLVFVGVILKPGQEAEIGLLDWKQAAQVFLERSRQTEREYRPFEQLKDQLLRDIAARKETPSGQLPLRVNPSLMGELADLPLYRAPDFVNFVLQYFWDLTPDYWLLAANFMLFTDPDNAIRAYVYADMMTRYTARRCSNGGESRVLAMRQQWSLPQWLTNQVTDYPNALYAEVERSGTQPVIVATDWVCNPPNPAGQAIARATDPVHPEHLWQRIWLDLMEDMQRDAAVLSRPRQPGESFARIFPPVY